MQEIEHITLVLLGGGIIHHTHKDTYEYVHIYVYIYIYIYIYIKRAVVNSVKWRPRVREVGSELSQANDLYYLISSGQLQLTHH